MQNIENVDVPKYKEGDYVLFMSRQPILHLNRMFGNMNETVIKEDKYKGTIKETLPTPIGTLYTVITLFPVEGFYCDAFEPEIIQEISPEEIERDVELRNQKYSNFVDIVL